MASSRRKNRIHSESLYYLGWRIVRDLLTQLSYKNSLLCHLLYTIFCVSISSCFSLSLFDSELRRINDAATFLRAHSDWFISHSFGEMNDNESV